MRRFWAVASLLAGWFGAAWAFFQKWFLPPAFPPDPPEEDETARRTMEQERQNRMGWATGQVVVEPRAHSQDEANANPPPAEPRYPTASRVEEGRVVESSGQEAEQGAEDGTQQEEESAPEDTGPPPARPSERGAFLEGAGEDDWRAFIRPPEGQPIARGAGEEVPSDPEPSAPSESALGSAGDLPPREESQPAPRPAPQGR